MVTSASSSTYYLNYFFVFLKIYTVKVCSITLSMIVKMERSMSRVANNLAHKENQWTKRLFYESLFYISCYSLNMRCPYMIHDPLFLLRNVLDKRTSTTVRANQTNRPPSDGSHPTSPGDLRWKVIKRRVCYPSLLINILWINHFQGRGMGRRGRARKSMKALK